MGQYGYRSAELGTGRLGLLFLFMIDHDRASETCTDTSFAGYLLWRVGYHDHIPRMLGSEEEATQGNVVSSTDAKSDRSLFPEEEQQIQNLRRARDTPSKQAIQPQHQHHRPLK